VRPILEESGLEHGRDFFLAFSPEREDPGNRDYDTRRIPKVVGGVDEVAQTLAQRVYSLAVDTVVSVASARAAEAVKLTENIFRAVNIALVNELKVVYARMGIDIWDVLDAASTKPFGFMRFNPGPGLGGHCIPIDPFYLTWKAREYGLTTRFIELAGEINVNMPRYVVERLQSALNDRGRPLRGSRVLILGVAYKKDIDDPRESPSFEIMHLLAECGAEVEYHDPHIPLLGDFRSWPELPRLESVPLTPAAVAGYTAVLIATDHSSVDYDVLAEHAQLIVDTRGVYRQPRKNVVKA
jgi:UDP-N-acetyl-D-glucosamine dehydrogenase